MKQSVLLTGASGFVGGHLAAALVRNGTKVICPVRSGFALEGAQAVPIPGIDEHTDWSTHMSSIDTVIHAAARVHVMNENIPDPLAEFRRVNVGGSLRLAQQAVEAGVRRFVYLSSIKVNGEETVEGTPFTETDVAGPQDSYGISKYEAEQGLLELAARTGLEVTIIRPPLVYGPGVKANFETMLRWVHRGIPLPLGAIHNKRSFVGIENLTSLVIRCIEHPAAANEIFLVSDGQDVSTTELLARCARALEVESRLLPVPQGLLQRVASLLGKEAAIRRLCGFLQVDIDKARRQLDWTPPALLDEGLRAAARSMYKI